MCELGRPLYVPTSCGMRRVGRTVGASVDTIIRPWCRSFSSPSQPLRPHTTVLHPRREGERDHSPTRLPLQCFTSRYAIPQLLKPVNPQGALRFGFQAMHPPGFQPLFRRSRAAGALFRPIRPRLRPILPSPPQRKRLRPSHPWLPHRLALAPHPLGVPLIG